MQRQFKFLPSNYLAICLTAAHAIALIPLYFLACTVWVKVALTVLLLIGLWFLLQRYAWLSAPVSSVMLVLESDNIVLTMRNGEQLRARVLSNSLVTPLLTVLNVLPHDTYFSRSIIIMPDSMDADAFRQLRVCLKWSS